MTNVLQNLSGLLLEKSSVNFSMLSRKPLIQIQVDNLVDSSRYESGLEVNVNPKYDFRIL